MYLFRFAAVAVFAIMLLPTGPSDNSSLVNLDGREAGFCSRYPKTCDASVELYTAFKMKLSYGVTLARQTLQSHSGSAHYADAPRHDTEKLGGRYGEESPPQRWDGTERGARGTLFGDERSAQWRGNN